MLPYYQFIAKLIKNQVIDSANEMPQILLSPLTIVL